MTEITPFVLYNWLQDSAIQKLIIDVRDPAIFDIGYIKTAINIPIVDDSPENHELDLTSLTETLTAKNKQFKSRGLIFSYVVVYDGNGEGTPAKRLVNALLKENKVANVKLLKGGYQTFVVQYPFLSSTSTKKAIGGTYPSAIVDSFLYLGSHDHAKSKQQLKDLGISYIVNMAGELENEFPDDFKYLSVKLDDTSGDNIAEHFEKTLKFIEDAQAASAKVLVHCAMGISRSSSIVIAYLMRVKGWSYEESHQFVKSMRSCIKPNPGFMTQLVEFEKKLKEAQETADITKAAEAMHILDQAIPDQPPIPTPSSTLATTPTPATGDITPAQLITAFHEITQPTTEPVPTTTSTTLSTTISPALTSTTPAIFSTSTTSQAAPNQSTPTQTTKTPPLQQLEHIVE
eukprot:Phypoly_transcript_07442.p1 GENE.Phypoly_transcript_07442~~Phypoly_transcript_07442.p1  ORF type:complete len:402 (+),score=79.49 Phypoly_transcript_07442:219-1424(+)